MSPQRPWHVPLLLSNQPALLAGAALGSVFGVVSTARRARLCRLLPPREPSPRTAMAGVRRLPGTWVPARPTQQRPRARSSPRESCRRTQHDERGQALSLSLCPGERDPPEQEAARAAPPPCPHCRARLAALSAARREPAAGREGGAGLGKWRGRTAAFSPVTPTRHVSPPRTLVPPRPRSPPALNGWRVPGARPCAVFTWGECHLQSGAERPGEQSRSPHRGARCRRVT